MHVIALIGNKGGAGKTTLCVNIAAAFATCQPTVILDADPQRSSLQWHDISEDQPAVDAMPASDNIARDIEQLANDYRYCLIDCPPSAQSTQMRQALAVSHLAIIPVQPSPLDIWATIQVEPEVASAINNNPALRPLVLVNQFESRSQLSRQTPQALDELSLPVAATRINRRVAYRHSFVEGKSVHDMGARGKLAADEIQQLIAELESFL